MHSCKTIYQFCPKVNG